MASDPKDEVRALLERINQAWLKGRPENLASTLNECFSEAIAFAGPAFQVVARGRDACVNGYADFIRAAKIDQCQRSDPVIEV